MRQFKFSNRFVVIPFTLLSILYSLHCTTRKIHKSFPKIKHILYKPSHQFLAPQPSLLLSTSSWASPHPIQSRTESMKKIILENSPIRFVFFILIQFHQTKLFLLQPKHPFSFPYVLYMVSFWIKWVYLRDSFILFICTATYLSYPTAKPKDFTPLSWIFPWKDGERLHYNTLFKLNFIISGNIISYARVWHNLCLFLNTVRHKVYAITIFNFGWSGLKNIDEPPTKSSITFNILKIQIFIPCYTAQYRQAQDKHI